MVQAWLDESTQKHPIRLDLRDQRREGEREESHTGLKKAMKILDRRTLCVCVSSIRDSRERRRLRLASRILSLEMAIVARTSKPGLQSQSMLGVAWIPLYPRNFGVCGDINWQCNST
ncbi:hypothetical protein F2P79_005331 [Pimephales promelas]|nr:hypothetical protein F2P79_005331 [Pimephales promelas]